MYTYIILALVFSLISGIIFRKNIKQNAILVVGIIFIGTLIGTTFVNGVLGLRIPFINVKIHDYQLVERSCEIIDLNTTLNFNTYLRYGLEINKDDSTRSFNTLYYRGSGHLFSTKFEFFETDEITLHYLAKGDTIPHVEIFKEKRLIDNNWISTMGLPNGKITYILYLPNDSIHNILVSYINKYYF